MAAEILKLCGERAEFGYGPQLLSYAPALQFRVQLKKLTRRPQTPFEEAKAAAHCIAEQFPNRKIYLCMSGGLDSEAMATAFLAAGVPFSAITFKMKNGLNSEETFFADLFCTRNQIQQKTIELDCEEFYESGRIFEYGHKYFPLSPEFVTHLWFLDSFDEPFIWGGEAFRTFNQDGIPVIQGVSEIEGVYERYAHLSNHSGVANFHFYSSEIAWSFFRSSLHYPNKTHYSESSPIAYTQKLDFYRYCGFPLSGEPTRKLKRHGFEQLKVHFDNKYNDPNYYQMTYREPFKKRYPLNGTSEIHFPKNDPLVSEILRERDSK